MLQNLLFSRKWFFPRASIRHKISFGYAAAIGVAVIGSTAGQIIGTHHTKQAMQQQELAHQEGNLLSDLSIAVLSARSHQQQFIPLLKNSKQFENEHTHFLGHLDRIKRLFSDVKSYAAAHAKNDPDIAKLQKWLQTYDGTTETYSQKLEALLQQIDVEHLQPTTVPAAQSVLLDFTNSEVALKFDGLSDDLGGLIEAAREEEEGTEALVDRAKALQIAIINVSLLLSVSLAIALAFFTSRAIARPIEAVTNVAQQAAKESNFDLEAPVMTQDEVGVLAASFNSLIQKVSKYTQELELSRQSLEKRVEERTQELRQALNDLRQTQSQLELKSKNLQVPVEPQQSLLKVEELLKNPRGLLTEVVRSTNLEETTSNAELAASYIEASATVPKF